jgi:hypothetical protein
MKSFAKEFLRDVVPGPARQIFLGAFGKHPGWDDHIDDLGLETESLVETKRRLYVDGVGSQLGGWEKLAPDEQINFDHVFVWWRDSQALVGRLWASSDGKKRSRYPMVICAHCTGVEVGAVLETLLTWLEELRNRTVATRSADAVRELLEQFRTGLRAWLESVEEPPNDALPGEAFLEEIDMASAGPAVMKTLYVMQESAFSAARYSSRMAGSSTHFRVLASTVSALNSLRFWQRALATQMAASVPILLGVPREQYWMDAIVGEPAPADFFCLRASPRALAMASDAEVEPPEAFEETARSVLRYATSGGPLERNPRSTWVSRLFGR